MCGILKNDTLYFRLTLGEGGEQLNFEKMCLYEK